MDVPSLRIGLAPNFLHADPERNLFKGKTLLFMEQSMAHYLMREGALPVLLPTSHGNWDVESIVAGFDGLLLQGGADMSPLTYGEEPMKPEWSGDKIRDDFEVALTKACFEADIPVFGICRGAQVINVAFGGTLYQDITTQREGSLVHRNWDIYEGNHHSISIVEGSALSKVYGGATEGDVNSIHHQGVKDLAEGMVAEAHAPDGIIEAHRWEDPSRYVSAVQWHPEFKEVDTPRDAHLLRPEPLLHDFFDAIRARR